MKIIFGLGHPAHFHLYKNIFKAFDGRISYKIVITDKDVLKKLLDEEGFEYIVLTRSKSNESLIEKLRKLIVTTIRLYKIASGFKPDLFVGCLSQIAWVAMLTRRPSVFNAEDDISYTLLQGLITYPLVTTILTPSIVNTGIFSYKRIGYAGYHKLAYLHPQQFTPDITIRNKYIKEDRFFLIRTVNQNAYHDINAKGLETERLKEVINVLEKTGAVYITSENALPDELEKYKLRIQAKDIHHLLYFADLLIADSQSMTVEAAMLGTPSIRFNSFSDKISVIHELEHTYHLTYSLNTNEKDRLIPLISEILNMDKMHYRERRALLLKDKINVTLFLSWFIENYPSSIKELKSNPALEQRFI